MGRTFLTLRVLDIRERRSRELTQSGRTTVLERPKSVQNKED